MLIDKPHKVTVTSPQGSHYSLFGAISNKSDGLCYMLHLKPKWEQFLEFLKHLVHLWPTARKAIIVMDQEGKHRATEVTKWLDEQGIEFYYQPSNSCQVNPIEHVWGTLKARWRNFLVKQQSHGLHGADWYEHILRLAEEMNTQGVGQYWKSCYSVYQQIASGELGE
jgi:hypothetical protein